MSRLNIPKSLFPDPKLTDTKADDKKPGEGKRPSRKRSRTKSISGYRTWT